MRIQIRNCVTDPRFKLLRKKGKPVFKPEILGSILIPGAVRIINSDDLELSDIKFLDFLVKNGSCEAVEIGVGPVDFDLWIQAIEHKPEEVLVDEDTQDMPALEPEIEEEEEVIEESEEEAVEEIIEEIEEIIEEESIIYTESELAEMKNADLRSLILEIDPDASLNSKSKKKLIALYLELTNA